jgi:hypothetical protein
MLDCQFFLDYINVRGKDIVLDKISVLRQESEWQIVYYWRTSKVTISDDLVTSTDITGTSLNIAVQGLRAFQQTNNNSALKSNWTMVLYNINPDSVVLNDVNMTVNIAVGITVFTSNAQYYTVTNIEVAQ